jgi:hypothetical protein
MMRGREVREVLKGRRLQMSSLRQSSARPRPTVKTQEDSRWPRSELNVMSGALCQQCQIAELRELKGLGSAHTHNVCSHRMHCYRFSDHFVVSDISQHIASLTTHTTCEDAARDESTDLGTLGLDGILGHRYLQSRSCRRWKRSPLSASSSSQRVSRHHTAGVLG